MLAHVLGSLYLPITVALASIAALGYMVSVARHGRKHWTLMDGLTIVVLMLIVTATAAPVLEAASQGARQSATMQNLQELRSQIALYKAQHGEPPLLYNGTFPQLLAATDAAGTPGPRGPNRPYGPYFPAGIPANPVTGRDSIMPAKNFPPATASGNGGWLYHQASGQIAADLPEMLGR